MSDWNYRYVIRYMNDSYGPDEGYRTLQEAINVIRQDRLTVDDPKTHIVEIITREDEWIHTELRENNAGTWVPSH